MLVVELIELSRANANVARRVRLRNHFVQLVDALPGLRRQKNDRRIVQKPHLIAQFFLKDFGRVRVLFDQVPLVHDNDDRRSGVVCVARDVRVHVRRAFDGVNQQQGHIGAFDMFARHHDRHLFFHQFGFAFAPNPGGVNHAQWQHAFFR